MNEVKNPDAAQTSSAARTLFGRNPWSRHPKKQENSNNNRPTSANGGQMWGTFGVEA